MSRVAVIGGGLTGHYHPQHVGSRHAAERTHQSAVLSAAVAVDDAPCSGGFHPVFGAFSRGICYLAACLWADPAADPGGQRPFPGSSIPGRGSWRRSEQRNAGT